MGKRQDAMIRQWRMIEKLNSTRRGLTIRQICEAVDASRATIYRDIKVLQGAGVPILTETVNSEARYRIDDHAAPPLVLNPLQLSAIFFARQQLSALEGTRLVEELNGLLAQAKADPELALSVKEAPRSTPDVSALVEKALGEHRRLRFQYASVKASGSSLRRVDPLSLHLSDNHLYLAAYDLDKGGLRTFKLLRMTAVEVLDEQASPHPEVDCNALFTRSIKAWSGEVVEVRVKIPARLARFVDEWPLVPEQQVLAGDGDSVVVVALVAGLVEPMRWVLRWGADAEAIAPPELRSMVAAEIARCLEQYPEAGSASGS
ncbi:MAG TPA: WYL domain-containing protein [Nannocystis exedens]|nr:WYL domain-containing protein [Nannocystis exedens]